jgi:hypothetical protein
MELRQPISGPNRHKQECRFATGFGATIRVTLRVDLYACLNDLADTLKVSCRCLSSLCLFHSSFVVLFFFSRLASSFSLSGPSGVSGCGSECEGERFAPQSSTCGNAWAKR